MFSAKEIMDKSLELNVKIEQILNLKLNQIVFRMKMIYYKHDVIILYFWTWLHNAQEI